MGKTTILIKRIYEPPEDADGMRILVDRLWARGLTKEKAQLDLWVKELAPSNELRKWYQHDPDKWDEFLTRYSSELDTSPDKVEELIKAVNNKTATFLYSSKEETLNNAEALKRYIEARL